MPRKVDSRKSRPAKQSDVGKGKPPKHSRFRKGQSGNPGGRPKGVRNLATIVREAADTPVTAIIGGKKRKITTLTATLFQLGKKAASGDSHAGDKFIKICVDVERKADERRPSEFPFEPADLEVLNTVYARLKLCEPPKAFE